MVITIEPGSFARLHPALSRKSNDFVITLDIQVSTYLHTQAIPKPSTTWAFVSRYVAVGLLRVCSL